MRACFFRKFGGPEVLELGEFPDPVPQSSEVIVDVHAASINAADWKMRSGHYQGVPFPHIPGRDFSGVVAGIGAKVRDFEVGDAVFGVCEVPREGAYAEKLAIGQAIIDRKPDALSHVESAAIALIGVTALISIVDTIQLKAGESILVHGGAGGVGGFAVALAKHLGGRVIATASAANLDYVRKLGAGEVIDYQREDFRQRVAACDAVFDTVGGEVTARSFEVLRPGGRLASVASGASAPKSPRSDVRSLRPLVNRDRSHLRRVAALLATGAIAVPPIVEYPLAEAGAAHQVSEARHLRGKLVLRIR